jgi:hypothetical protein
MSPSLKEQKSSRRGNFNMKKTVYVATRDPLLFSLYWCRGWDLNPLNVDSITRKSPFSLTKNSYAKKNLTRRWIHVRRKNSYLPSMRQSKVIQKRDKIHPFRRNSALPVPWVRLQVFVTGLGGFEPKRKWSYHPRFFFLSRLTLGSSALFISQNQ